MIDDLKRVTSCDREKFYNVNSFIVISLTQRFNFFNYDCFFLVHRRARISAIIDNFINIAPLPD